MGARTLLVDSGGVTRQGKRWAIVDAGGVTRFAKRIFIVDSGSAAHLVFSPNIVAVASPTGESASGFAPINLATGTTTVTASGGSPPYTYAWTWQTGGVGINIGSPSSASTNFGAFLNPGDNLHGTALCTVTDSVGTTGTATCTVHISSTN